MAKITLTSLLGGLFSRSALNRNFDKIVDEFNNRVLYRDNPPGTANQMKNELDMNRNRIVNVSTPESSSDVATKRYVDDVATGLQMPSTNGTFDSIVVDEIDEKTANAGVNIDGAVLKDGDGNFSTVTATTSVVTDTIGERTSDAGVTVGGVLLKDGAFSASTVNADVIAEKTNDTGVTIDGVLLKDEGVFVGSGDYLNGTDIGVSKGSAAIIEASRTTEDREGAFVYLSKARGALGAQTIVSNNDKTGGIVFQGHDGTNLHPYSAIQGEVLDSTIGSEVGRLHFYASRAGSLTNIVTLSGGYASAGYDSAEFRPSFGITKVNLGSNRYPFDGAYVSTFLAGNGTAIAPSYSFEDDTSTGLYRPKSDSIGVVNNATLTATFESDNYFSVAKGITHAVFTNSTRPAPTSVPAGTQIWNSDDNAPNYSDGTAWRAADGTVT